MHEDKGLARELVGNQVIAMPDIQQENRKERRARMFASVHVGSHKNPIYRGKRIKGA